MNRFGDDNWKENLIVVWRDEAKRESGSQRPKILSAQCIHSHRTQVFSSYLCFIVIQLSLVLGGNIGLKDTSVHIGGSCNNGIKYMSVGDR